MELVRDEALLATRTQDDVWSMTSPAENGNVYRAEYLAHQIMKSSVSEWSEKELQEMLTIAEIETDGEQDALLAVVQKFMATRHQENYTKGIHDHDATLILRELLSMHSELGAARYAADARALALAGMHELASNRTELYQQLTAQLQSLHAMRFLFESNQRDHADAARVPCGFA